MGCGVWGVGCGVWGVGFGPSRGPNYIKNKIEGKIVMDHRPHRPTECGDLGDHESGEPSSEIGEWGSIVVSSTGVNLGTGLSRSRVRFQVPPRGGGARCREPEVDLKPCGPCGPCGGDGFRVPLLVFRLSGTRGFARGFARGTPSGGGGAAATGRTGFVDCGDFGEVAFGVRPPPPLERSMTSSPCRPIGGALAADGNRSIFSWRRPARSTRTRRGGGW